MDSSQHVEAFEIGEGSSQAMDEVSCHTIIQVEDDSSQHDKDATPQLTVTQEGDSSSPHAKDSTPSNTVVHEKLQHVVDMFKDSSNSWYKNRSLMKKMDNDGMCPVHLAAMTGDLKIIKEFMQLMPNCVDIRSKDGETALHIAVKYVQPEAVKMLLSNKEDRNVRKMVSHDCDKDGNTALHLAVIHEADRQIMRELLKRPGVGVNAENKAGLTALDIAVHHYPVLFGEDDDRRSNCEKLKTILEAVGGCGRYSRREGKEGKIVGVDTVVASLIATTTFAAIIQIPGEIENDENSGLYGGAKNLDDAAFRWFSMYNTVALFTSLTVVIMWLLRERLPGEFVYTNRSKVAGLSAICLGISVICTGLAALCAYYLIVTPFRDSRMSPKQVSAYKYLFWVVIVAASLAPAVAWTTFLVMLVYKFYNFISTRRPDPSFLLSLSCSRGWSWGLSSHLR